MDSWPDSWGLSFLGPGVELRGRRRAVVLLERNVSLDRISVNRNFGFVSFEPDQQRTTIGDVCQQTVNEVLKDRGRSRHNSNKAYLLTQ